MNFHLLSIHGIRFFKPESCMNINEHMGPYNPDLHKIEEFVQLNGKALLEVGCGDGRLTALLANKAETITAIDPDETSIETARRNNTGVNFRVGSGERLDFFNETFDIVLFSYSLHHQDCVKALAEAKRVVRQDGQILIIEPAIDGEFTRLVSLFEKDEIPLLQKTLDYITSNSFTILGKDTYCVDYPFPAEKELYKYFMTKFMTEKIDRAEEKMQEIIGSKRNDKPVIIKDMVNIFLIAPH
jgi:ubiquinone/menaquinone biosynthesis C-methylase UbiE